MSHTVALFELCLRRLPVWPYGQIDLSIFGHLQRWKFAQKHLKCPKWVHNFAKYQMNLKMLPKISKFLLGKVTTFRQIWSHWQLLSRSHLLHSVKSLSVSLSPSKTSSSCYITDRNFASSSSCVSVKKFDKHGIRPWAGALVYLVVLGDDSCSKGRGFESSGTVYWMDIFHIDLL